MCRLKFLTHFGDLSSLFVKRRVDLENNDLEAVLLGRSDLLNNVSTFANPWRQISQITVSNSMEIYLLEIVTYLILFI